MTDGSMLNLFTMKIHKLLNPSDYAETLKRPTMDTSTLFKSVDTMLKDIKQNGEVAVKKYIEKFDYLILNELKVSDDEFLAYVTQTESASGLRVTQAVLKSFAGMFDELSVELSQQLAAKR